MRFQIHFRVAAVAALLCLATPALALIERLTDLAFFIDESDVIVVAKVEKFDAERPVAIFVMQESLKGKAALDELAVNLKGEKPVDALGRPDGQETRWAFTHLETYLPRTFRGSTEQLRETIAAVLAKKQKGPKADPKAPVGIGPPVAGKPKS